MSKDKTIRKLRNRLYYLEHKDNRLNYIKNWNQENKEKCKEYKKKYRTKYRNTTAYKNTQRRYYKSND